MIRLANSQDIPRIMDLLLQVGMMHHNGRPDIFKADSAKYTADELEGILRDENTPVFVAVDEQGYILGYAFCIFVQHKDHNILTDIKTLYIDDLCVDETVRGQHVGRNLYEYVLQFARENQCYNVTLNVWGENKAAMGFYEKCGLQVQKIGMEALL